MSQSNTLNVQILDKEYCIACPPDERVNLESAARYAQSRGTRAFWSDSWALAHARRVSRDSASACHRLPASA